MLLKAQRDFTVTISGNIKINISHRLHAIRIFMFIGGQRLVDQIPAFFG
jgi:hypothetical protein